MPPSPKPSPSEIEPGRVVIDATEALPLERVEVLHHKAFDLGAFTIQTDQVLLVSERTYGRSGFDEWLLRFHGQPIRKPLRASYLPGNDSSWLGTRSRCSSDRQGSWKKGGVRLPHLPRAK